MPRTVLALLGALAVVLAGCGDDDDQPTATPVVTTTVGATARVTLPPGVTGKPQTLPERQITFETDDGTVELTAEIADDGAELGLGLMFRELLPEDHGMLFVFGEERGTTFHMANTLIPLSIAFIKADGTIVHIEDMEPLTLNGHPSPEPVAYALEVNQGWFEREGVEVGDVVVGLP